MLRDLPTPTHPDLLVSSVTGDDAAVWRIDDERALVLTTDVITPVVDDARTWGRVAATNAVSDVYAMGGTPLLALSFVGWNTDELGLDALTEALAGVHDVAAADGFVIVGGHSITDPEPKLGLAVVGIVHPDRVFTNAGVRPGDVLVLTKPLGIGVVTTAIKRDRAGAAAVDAAVTAMTTSNRIAAAVARRVVVHAATDVTGFGLVGHVGRMALESGVDVTIDVTTLPVVSGARDLAAAGVVPGGTQRNLDAIGDRLVRGDASDVDVAIVADPQTSGGLVLAVPAAGADALVSALAAEGVTGVVIGAATSGTGRLLLRSGH